MAWQRFVVHERCRICIKARGRRRRRRRRCSFAQHSSHIASRKVVLGGLLQGFYTRKSVCPSIHQSIESSQQCVFVCISVSSYYCACLRELSGDLCMSPSVFMHASLALEWCMCSDDRLCLWACLFDIASCQLSLVCLILFGHWANLVILFCSEDHKPPMTLNPTWDNIATLGGNISGSQSRQQLQKIIPPSMMLFHAGKSNSNLSLAKF